MGNLQQCFTFKVMVLGDPAVGKTSLIHRFVANKFEEEYTTTIGVDFLVKEIETADGFKVRLVLWDVAGQSKYASFKRRYYNGSNFVIVVFDVANPQSCIHVRKWIGDAHHILGRGIPFTVLANKVDLAGIPSVTEYRPIFELAVENPHTYLEMMETSAKTGKNVDTVFRHIARFLTKRSNC